MEVIEMAIKYPAPVKDYADRKWIQDEVRRVRLDEHELKLVDDSEESSISKVATAIIITAVLLLSLYLFSTQAKANDGNYQPISPMSLVDSWGKE